MERLVWSEHDKRIVFVPVDAQNTFGAPIRTYYLVAFRIGVDDYSYNKRNSITECRNPPENDEIDTLKIMADYLDEPDHPLALGPDTGAQQRKLESQERTQETPSDRGAH